MSESNSFDVSKVADRLKNDRNLMLIVIGFAAALVGNYLPWYSFEFLGVSATLNGSDANGILLVIIAVLGVAAALNVLGRAAKEAWITTVVIGAVGLLSVINDYPSGSGANEFGSIGIGYWLSLAGVGLATAVAAMKLKENAAGGSKPAATDNDDSSE